MEQTPSPGRHILAFCGDTIVFTLRAAGARRGRAFLRANIGHAATARMAIVAETTLRQKRLAEDWFDIPMTPAGGDLYRIVLPLTEPGHFEAKAFFLPEQGDVPLWPEGGNVSINIHPAEYCCANTLYNAFTRLFAPEQSGREETDALGGKCVQLLDSLGYAVIPPSGTFRELASRLDFIVGRLGCRILMLLPIHPTPTVYGRMGRFGSPYAALDFLDVDPALAEFDRKATPLEQFGELVDAVHARGAKLFLDIAINHTGWAAKIHALHPEWLVRDAGGTIQSPGAWGNTWADLTGLDYTRPELWHYLAEVFLSWCRRGVDGFRCDAGYKIPVPAWEFIVASVRREFPGAMFLLEGLGGEIEVTRALLNESNLNWAYSELFQNYDRAQVERYLAFAAQVSEGEGLLMHFAETHDNNRLAARSPVYARMRTALSALCSSNGAFAFANGVEWFAAEKIDVHKRTSLNWNSPVNQVDFIARLNRILSGHPAFFHGARLKLIQRGAGNSIALLRHHPPTGRKALVLVNLDDRAPQPVAWSDEDKSFSSGRLVDLLTGREITASASTGLELAPGEALCLTADANDLRLVGADGRGRADECLQVYRQRLRAKALEAFVAVSRLGDVSGLDPDQLADELARDPRSFCRKIDSLVGEERVALWNWPADVRREVMVPPGHFLLARAPFPFRAMLQDGRNVLEQEDAIRQADGSYFALFMPRPPRNGFLACDFNVFMYAPDGTQRASGHVLFLPEPGKVKVKRTFRRNDLPAAGAIVLGTNGRGGMMRAAVRWGELRSKYDALLAGNLSPDYPEDRRVMLARCRAWLVFQSYSQDITIDRLELLAVGGEGARWQFRVPFGYGKMVFLEAASAMLPGRNAVRIVFKRLKAEPGAQSLGDGAKVRLIVRPDIEDRNFHEDTKAFLGPEQAFPRACAPGPDGFDFAPAAGRRLRMTVSPGAFRPAPEWHYMVHHELEAERGLEADSDLFSPGYFESEMRGGDEVEFLARIVTDREPDQPAPRGGALPARDEEDIGAVLEQAMRQFIVRRDGMKTVIAGYPWFLDWGRDTLIFCRGMVAAGMIDDALAIVRRFASFEENGTLPNMIAGDKAGNRDSSDAPLWLFAVCADLKRALGNGKWLREKCAPPGGGRDGRTLLEVLAAIAEAYRRGTPNGIACDLDSGLVFSPAHFTWMDTNFPAGTPRAGYPVEIQALWHSALRFLAEVTGEGQWNDLARLVQESVVKLYWRNQDEFLADCLHASPGVPAAKARADDALRPNQLLAITLGLVDEREMSAQIISACGNLVVPGGIRSLADRPVSYPLKIERDGKLLNDPGRPYWGKYEGDEDTRRKPAYHNGTAWTWLFPSFCEAWHMRYGKAGKATALALLNSSARLLNRGCLGQLPEILDGDYPHAPRGCDAQAWGASELYRVWKMLNP